MIDTVCSLPIVLWRPRFAHRFRLQREMMSDASTRELSGKVAVVTGASSGIGRAVALELASAGADVFLHARASPQLKDVAGEVRARGRHRRDGVVRSSRSVRPRTS